MDIENILIVDNCLETCELIADYMGACVPTSDILVAVDGSQALELFCQHRIDLIITEVHLQKMSGIELIKTIRQEVENTQTYIIVITEEVNGAVIKRCAIAGADDYLTKPFSQEQLQVKIERIQVSTNRHSRLRKS